MLQVGGGWWHVYWERVCLISSRASKSGSVPRSPLRRRNDGLKVDWGNPGGSPGGTSQRKKDEEIVGSRIPFDWRRSKKLNRAAIDLWLTGTFYPRHTHTHTWWPPSRWSEPTGLRRGCLSRSTLIYSVRNDSDSRKYNWSEAKHTRRPIWQLIRRRPVMRHRNRIVYYSAELLSFVLCPPRARIFYRNHRCRWYSIHSESLFHTVSHGIVNTRFLMLKRSPRGEGG